MPHCIAGLARLFAHTTHGNFTATFGGVHESTTAFNSLVCDVGLEQSASHQHLIPIDVCHHRGFGKQAAVRELVCNSGLYTWNVC